MGKNNPDPAHFATTFGFFQDGEVTMKVYPFLPFREAIGFQGLPLAYFFWLFLTLAAYFAVMQVVKVLYIRRFKTWL